MILRGVTVLFYSVSYRNQGRYYFWFRMYYLTVVFEELEKAGIQVLSSDVIIEWSVVLNR